VFAAAGYKGVDRTTVERAREYEQRGIWRREYDTVTGELKGFRIEGADVNRVDADLAHQFTAIAISKTEMEVNAMGTRASHTFRLTEPERLQRMKNGLPPEDAVERTLAKVRCYPHVGASKGDILKAWPHR
jgi:hypothetical protein